jgi:hypothetical protein
VARGYEVVPHRTRLKNEVLSILRAHLIPKCPHADLFNARGRVWLAALQPLFRDQPGRKAHPRTKIDHLVMAITSAEAIVRYTSNL